MILGIDPGLDGAFAFVGDGWVEFVDMPTLEVATGNRRRRRIDAHAIVTALHRIESEHGPLELAAIEELSAWPGAARQTPGSIATSNFSLGRSSGLLEGILVTSGIPFERVRPQAWKRAMMPGAPKEKSASILRAKELFPAAASRLARKKDHGRADALLIAEYVRRELGTSR